MATPDGLLLQLNLECNGAAFRVQPIQLKARITNYKNSFRFHKQLEFEPSRSRESNYQRGSYSPCRSDPNECLEIRHLTSNLRGPTVTQKSFQRPESSKEPARRCSTEHAKTEPLISLGPRGFDGTARSSLRWRRSRLRRHSPDPDYPPQLSEYYSMKSLAPR